MEKGSGTRSGLLWEVERLLNEVDELPQILLMENVPQVIAAKNRASFDAWKSFLESKGYSNHYSIMNAKDHGVAQSRKRFFRTYYEVRYEQRKINIMPILHKRE